jgi:hypothetical protein
MCNCASCIQEESREKIWDLEWKVHELESEINLLREHRQIAVSALKNIAKGEHPDEAQAAAQNALEKMEE